MEVAPDSTQPEKLWTWVGSTPEFFAVTSFDPHDALVEHSALADTRKVLEDSALLGDFNLDRELRQLVAGEALRQQTAQTSPCRDR
ncbi:hypothetical protein G418_10891 [Rhodococcus qingshengii BKS 20-40]|nr:hypothetical protein G418_10891 [Rhodococcus qingshengii BKS 20-40]